MFVSTKFGANLSFAENSQASCIQGQGYRNKNRINLNCFSKDIHTIDEVILTANMNSRLCSLILVIIIVTP